MGTSAEFKRERDTFHALCKDLERTEVKKWLNQILEILMAERAKSQQETENEKLAGLIKKHEELIPTVQKTAVMVDLYWKCYAYGDELKPHIEFLDGIMLSSTRDIAPSCVEMWMNLLRGRRSLSHSLTPREVLLLTSLLRARASWSTLTNPSSLKAMSSVFRRVGMIPNRRLKRG